MNSVCHLSKSGVSTIYTLHNSFFVILQAANTIPSLSLTSYYNTNSNTPMPLIHNYIPINLQVTNGLYPLINDSLV